MVTFTEKFFDAHCDTVLRQLEGDLDFVAGQGTAHMDLPRLLEAGAAVQLFAVFAARSYYRDVDLTAHVDKAIAAIRGWVEASDDRLRLALTAGDLRQACGSGPTHALLGIEGADFLEGHVEDLVRYAAAGIRNIIPAWDDNALSGSAFGEDRALSQEGLALVELAQDLRIMVDVSHISDSGFAQVCDVARRPFVASHSNCRALCPARRNLTDEMILQLADRGGVMGVNLAPLMLEPQHQAGWDARMKPIQAAMLAAGDGPEREALKQREREILASLPLPGIEWVVRHIQHAMNVGGEECVGLGGDLDGIEVLPAGMTGVESYGLLSQALADAGLSQAQLEKVFWRNMLRVFTDVLPA